MKVIAVVVTYNRKKLLKECVEALVNQTLNLYKIIIVNNASTDGTFEYLQTENLFNNENIDIINLAKNTGGAGGFEVGVRAAYTAGADYVWLMDDDAEPARDCIEILISQATKENMFAVCPLIVGMDGKPQIYHHKRIDVWGREKSVALHGNANIKLDANAFVGPLFHRKVIEVVGYPDGRYFIWGDDTEYTWRVSKEFKIYLLPKAIIKHKDNRTIGASRTADELWKREFMIRNSVHIRRKHAGFLALIFGLMWFFGMLITWGRVNKMAAKFICRAYLEGWAKLDGSWRPGSKKFS